MVAYSSCKTLNKKETLKKNKNAIVGVSDMAEKKAKTTPHSV